MTITAVSMFGKAYEVDSSDASSWRIGAHCLIVKNQQILLIPFHAKDELRYDLPGGEVEIPETLEQGAIREVFEETGLAVNIEKSLMTHDHFFIWDPENEENEREVIHSLVTFFLCSVAEDGNSISTSGHDAWERKNMGIPVWIDLRDAVTLPVVGSFDYRPLIQGIIDGN